MRKAMLMLLFLLPSCYMLAGTCSTITDYFRSIQSGDWNTLTTWQSSPDNATWTAATLVPNSSSNTVSIRAGHTVTWSTNGDLDQLVIESGGIFVHSANTMVINDGAGDDIDVKSGGIFTLASNSNPPVFFSGGAKANIATGAILRVSATGLTGAGTGVNANNYIYQNASVLEYTLNLAFSSAGVTFFPNANVLTIPIFRTTGNLGLIGAATPTIFNGIFEANGTITFQNAGTKTFRDGIKGTGNMTSDPACGKFIINGADAILGGTGSLTLPASGMDIGPTTTVNMVSNKTVIGNIALLASAGLFLGNYDLTMTGDINGGSLTSHIVTNGTGKLLLNNILAAARFFPVGANNTTYNPVSIQNGGGLNYGVRVATGINPAISVPFNAVNRTWFITPNGGTPGTVNTNFYYAAGEANAGFNYAGNLELGLFTGAWNVIQTGIVPAGSYQVATTVSTFGNNIEAPLVLANLYAILSVDNPITINYFTGTRSNGNHLLNWKFTCVSVPSATIEMERSTDGLNYSSIYSIFATALLCQQPFNYKDAQPAKGINYYRLKMTDADGKVTYSTVVPLINATRGIDVMNIAPNPIVNSSFNLQISSADKTQMELVITDMQGRIVRRQYVNLVAGFNTILMNVKNLAAGTYQLFGYTADGRTRVLRFVIQ